MSSYDPLLLSRYADNPSISVSASASASASAPAPAPAPAPTPVMLSLASLIDPVDISGEVLL